MTTPTTGTAYTTLTSIGTSNIDSLLCGTRWSSTSITYSFPNYSSYWSTNSTYGYGPSYGSGEPWTGGYAGLASSDISAVKSAMTAWSNVSTLTFTQVSDNVSTVGDLRLAYATLDHDAQAWAYTPSYGPAAGDIWFNSDSSSYDYTWTAGSYEYLTAIHEIGHALGLKHPFEALDNNSTIISSSLDSRSYTIMSYSAAAGNTSTYFNYEPTTPMVLDVAAIQMIYGANTSYNSGNTNYTFSGSSYYHQTIWDAGGTDTIVYTGSSGGVIDLREGTDAGSRLGQTIYVEDSSYNVLYAVNNIWIAYDTVIENATGGSGNDSITGNDANNILDGSAGNDTLIGGAGNDTYIVDNVGDVVTEAANAGTDAVIVKLTSGTYSATANVENITLYGSATLNATGNALANTIIGNAAANILDGGEGADSMNGGGGNDTYYVDNVGELITDSSGTDTVIASISYSLSTALENLTLSGNAAINGYGNALANILMGNSGANILDGGDGNDTLDGATGNDTLIGGKGADVYVIDSANDIIQETLSGAAGGSDLVKVAIASAGGSYTLGSNLENATLTNTVAFNLVGNELANVLTGNTLDNTLDGADGVDALIGALGNDTYLIDLTSSNLLQDTITEAASAGTDSIVLRGGNTTLSAAVTITLAANFENLNAAATSSARLNLAGNAADNILVGNDADNTLDGGAGNDSLDGGAGNDILNGGIGADTLSGGSGDDIYLADHVNDVITEATSAGTDTVKVAIASAGGSYTLGSNLENATLTNTVAFNLTGNELDNILTGNDGANTLDGANGNDTLIGGKGADTFRFDSLLNATTNVDTITDFMHGTDKIALDDAIFTALTSITAANLITGAGTTAASTTDQHLIYDSTTGDLYYDADGSSSSSDAVLFALLGTSIHPTLTASDFSIV
jgi:serralysin